jgi:hypothetical protein
LSDQKSRCPFEFRTSLPRLSLIKRRAITLPPWIRFKHYHSVVFVFSPRKNFR